MILPPSLRSRRRVDIPFHQRGIPSIIALGRYNYSQAMEPLNLHRHENALEICYLARGRQCYEAPDGHYELRGGDVFMTQPDEEHGTGQFPEEKGLLYWLIVRDPKQSRNSLLGLPPDESKALWQKFAGIRHRHFLGNPHLKDHLDAAITLASQRQSPLTRATIRNHLLSFLLEILQAYAASRIQFRKKKFDAIIRHVEANLDDQTLLNVNALARMAGLSASRFKTSFKAATGIPPAEFVLRMRIAEAERRLSRPGASVTRVAYDLGFSSSQYFSSVFRRFLNKSPSAWKRK